MATISENLQTIKNSTDAIKQAIIDKGGTINGDITTWADAISGISGEGGSSGEEYVFTGTVSYSGSKVTLSGSLNKVPSYTGRNYLLALGYFTGGICYGYTIQVNDIGPHALTIDFKEPLGGNEIPAICILNIVESTHVVVPVKFQYGDMSTDPT